MKSFEELCSTTLDLRSECEKVPFWVGSGISGAEGDDKDKDEPTAREKALQEEKDRHYTKRQEAEAQAAAEKKEKEELAARLKEIEDKDKSDLEKAQSDLVKMTKRAEEAEAAKDSETQGNLTLRKQVAFMGNKLFAWHDPETALKLVEDHGEITIKDGKVEGLEAAIKAMAKAKPFLVKTGNSGGTEGGEGGEGTGAATNGASTRTGAAGNAISQARAAELSSKYKMPR